MMKKNNFKDSYDNNGFSVVKGVIKPSLANEIKNHIKWLSGKYPNTRPEAFHHNMLIHDPFIHHLINQDIILDYVQEIIGQNIALFGAHYIAKKPLSGQPVGWHQDGSYWPLEPMNVVSIWLAGTYSGPENGCMRVIPGTQKNRLLKPSQMIKLDTSEFVLDLAIRPEEIDDNSALDIKLNPGDMSIHNPFIIHGSNPNKSTLWRIGLTLRFIPTTTYVNRTNWECVLLRGKNVEGIKNNYIDKPIFIDGEHMPFKGCHKYK
ncbi:MAG: phytanoyl-CoA dioxygenase [Candidatus Marinimicrobia bacterium]|nr:phytanoyl-CoA dioxygenase [Candidatus Neomarinimicrobiota bacterium]